MVNIWKIFPNNGFSIKNQPLLGNINHIYWRIVYHWFVVWNHGILWLSHHIGKFIIPTDELIFFRGIGIPPTSNAKWRMVDWWWLMINDTDDGNKDDTITQTTSTTKRTTDDDDYYYCWYYYVVEIGEIISFLLFFVFSVLKQDLSTTILPFVGWMGGYVVRLCSYLEWYETNPGTGNEHNWNTLQMPGCHS